MVKRSRIISIIGAFLLCQWLPTASAQNLVVEWVRTFRLEPRYLAEGAAISQAPDGSLIVAGSAANSLGHPEYVALKFAANGERLWLTRYAADHSDANRLRGIAVDEAGNTILTGSSGTVKIDSAGSRVWTAEAAGESIASNSEFTYIASPSPSGYRIVQLGNQPRPPADLILDCDLGMDVDDLSDVAIANILMSRGEINMLATMVSHPGVFKAEATQIMNRYYGHPGIEVGIAMDGPPLWDTYAGYMTVTFGPTIGYTLPVPDALSAYRRILSGRPDHSVTLVFAGQLRNLFNLWNSGPDNYSRLYGPALLTRKIKEIFVAAGFFPSSGAGGEFNLATDPVAAQVLNHITNAVPVKFVGIELGNSLRIPANGIAQLDADNPVRKVYQRLGISKRESWSGPALLCAARGPSCRGNNYFTSVRGRVQVQSNGANSFVQDPTAKQGTFLKRKETIGSSTSWMTCCCNSLQMRPPPRWIEADRKFGLCRILKRTHKAKFPSSRDLILLAI